MHTSFSILKYFTSVIMAFISKLYLHLNILKKLYYKTHIYVINQANKVAICYVNILKYYI